MMPVRCYTCQRVVGNKYKTFTKRLHELHERQTAAAAAGTDGDGCARDVDGDVAMTEAATTPYPVQRIFDDLCIKKACCRRMLLTHVPIVEKMLLYPQTC